MKNLGFNSQCDEILLLLKDREMTQSELADVTGLSAYIIRDRLSLMKDTGEIVSYREKGRVLYKLAETQEPER